MINTCAIYKGNDNSPSNLSNLLFLNKSKTKGIENANKK